MNSISKDFKANGGKVQINKISNNPDTGAKKNPQDPVNGLKDSLKKSFKASANGCKKPFIEILFGPLRFWDKPKIFRSIKVKKATLTKTGSNTSIKLINEKIFFYLFKVTLLAFL